MSIPMLSWWTISCFILFSWSKSDMSPIVPHISPYVPMVFTYVPIFSHIFPWFSHMFPYFRHIFPWVSPTFHGETSPRRQACGNVVYGYGGEVALQCRSLWRRAPVGRWRWSQPWTGDSIIPLVGGLVAIKFMFPYFPRNIGISPTMGQYVYIYIYTGWWFGCHQVYFPIYWE